MAEILFFPPYLKLFTQIFALCYLFIKSFALSYFLSQEIFNKAPKYFWKTLSYSSSHFFFNILFLGIT